MTLRLQASKTTAQTDDVSDTGSEMRGVLELQAMLLLDLARRENQIQGFSNAAFSSQISDLERYRVDTAEALQKVWDR